MLVTFWTSTFPPLSSEIPSSIVSATIGLFTPVTKPIPLHYTSITYSLLGLFPIIFLSWNCNWSHDYELWIFLTQKSDTKYLEFFLIQRSENCRYQQNVYSNTLLKFCFIEQNNVNVMKVWNFDPRIFSVYVWAWALIFIFGSQWIDYLCWHWCREEPSRQPPGQPAWTAQTTAAASPFLVPGTRQKRPGLLWNPIVCGGSVGYPYPESMYPWITK